MSAVDIFLEANRALIFTDAAVYDAEGKLLAVNDKARVTESRRLVVTGRGNAWFFPALARSLADWTIDEVEADGGEFFDICFDASEAFMIEQAGKANNDVFVVGWSEKDRKPKIAQWSNCAPAGVARFSMVDSVMAPEPDAEGYAAIQRAMGPISRESADYVKLGVAVMEAQRRTVGLAAFAAEGQFLVGGHVQMTEVSAKGIIKRVVHTWSEDRIGEKIRPAPSLDPTAHPNVTALPMNRADRRRMEKAGRRGAA